MSTKQTKSGFKVESMHGFILFMNSASLSNFGIEMLNSVSSEEWRNLVGDKVVQMAKGAIDSYRGKAKQSSNQDYMNGFDLMFHKRKDFTANHKTHIRTSKAHKGGKDD